jgi:general secretion pathway protein G
MLGTLHRRRSGGFTIAELITVVAIIAILSAIAMPVARFGLRRQKEIELRDRLRKITDAIDRYHELMTMNAAPPQVQPGQAVPPRPAQMQELGSEGYPKDLDELLKGVEMSDGKTVRLLRERDLIDPMTGRKEWIVKSTQDDPESVFDDVCTVGGSCSAENVFEIHSTSTALSLDGKTHYNEW